MAQRTVSRPSDDGFYLPAEWCRHARSWIAWPGSGPSLTANNETMKEAVATVVNTIREFEPVTVVVNEEDVADVERRCGRKIDLVHVPHESARMRDFGPTFLVDGKGGSAAVDWGFDGWNNASPEWENDAKACHAILGDVEIRRFRAPLVLEGSSICSDGQGTAIVSGSTALDPKRNNGISKLEAYDVLSHWIGTSRVIWLDPRPKDDATVCDVHRFCAFTAPGHVLVGTSNGGAFDDHLTSLTQRLSQSDDARGHRLQVERLPFLEKHSGTRTYTSFYVLNTAVLVPRYGDPEDDGAAQIIGNAFPGRAVKQVDAEALAAGGSSLSSLIQYQPARLLERDKATLLPKSAWHRPVPDYIGLLEAYIEKVESD